MGSLIYSELIIRDTVLRPVFPEFTTRVPILTPSHSMKVDILGGWNSSIGTLRSCYARW